MTARIAAVWSVDVDPLLIRRVATSGIQGESNPPPSPTYDNVDAEHH